MAITNFTERKQEIPLERILTPNLTKRYDTEQ